MTVVSIVSIILHIAMVILVLKLCKKYRNLYDESVQDKTVLVTLSKFVIHTMEHSDKRTVANDMMNAVKTCVNKGYYDITPINSDCTDNIAYYSFAEQMFKFIEDMDKE